MKFASNEKEYYWDFWYDEDKMKVYFIIQITNIVSNESKMYYRERDIL